MCGRKFYRPAGEMYFQFMTLLQHAVVARSRRHNKVHEPRRDQYAKLEVAEVSKTDSFDLQRIIDKRQILHLPAINFLESFDKLVRGNLPSYIHASE